MASIHCCNQVSPRAVRLKRLSLAAALACLGGAGAPALAEDVQALPTVTITAQKPSVSAHSQVSGFGDTPVWDVPIQAQTYTLSQLRGVDAQRLSDITTLDASVSDSYNAAGYWDIISVRGYTLDNQNNYRREGLPISAETSIPLDNKEAVELLKGASGMQAGVSAPGGMVNFLVKRPTLNLLSARTEFRDGSALAAVDLSRRFGVQDAFGLRFNAAVEHLDPQLFDSQGHRQVLALAADWHVAPGSTLEAEVETSHRSQPSQPGFSLLGDTLPKASSIDPRINLNNQAWSLPVVFDATTATLRWTQELAQQWRLKVTAGTQQLKTDDRTAFPNGLYDLTQPAPPCNPCDRFSADGHFTLWDYESDNEHRRTDALDFQIHRSFDTGAQQHDFTVGVLRSVFKAIFGPLTYNPAGTGSIDGATVVPPAPGSYDGNANRHESSTEWYIRDHAVLSHQWEAWMGLRSTQLQRASELTNGSQAVSYKQAFTTPWIALSRPLSSTAMIYASWGQGVETYVTPNKTGYNNLGQPLPAARSHQFELGLKAHAARVDWALVYFDISRPNVTDTRVDYFLDGKERHQGLEAQGSWHVGAWDLGASGLLIDAKIRGSSDASVNGQRPINVPDHALKLHAAYHLASVQGLSFSGSLVHEGRREILLPNSLTLPTWTRVDLGVEQHIDTRLAEWTLSAGLINAFDRRAWQESPFQYGHVYLYPLAPRTLYVALQTTF